MPSRLSALAHDRLARAMVALLFCVATAYSHVAAKKKQWRKAL